MGFGRQMLLRGARDEAGVTLVELIVVSVVGVLQRKIVGVGKVDCPGSKCVERRVYQEATANVSASGISLGLNLLSNLQLQLYRKQPGTFRECSSEASGAAPDSGC